MRAKLSGLFSASSASILELSATPFLLAAPINLEYESFSSSARSPALMRTFHSRRKSFFLSRRWAKAYLPAWKMASLAARFLVERAWREPLVIARIFLRRLFDVTPPFTRALKFYFFDRVPM